MSATKKKPNKAHKPAGARTVKPRRHRLHVPPGGSFAFNPTSMSQAMVDRLFWRAGFGPTRGRPRRVDRQAARRGRRLAARTRPRARSSAPSRTRDGKPLDPTGDDTDLVLAWVDRMVRTTQPAGRAHDVLLAPPLGQLARGGLAAAAAARTRTRSCASTRDLAANPDVDVPRHGARGVQGPVDAALPERRVQRQGRPERELRPRADGALRARRDARHHRRARTTPRTTSRSSRRRSPAGTSTTRDPDNAKALFDSGPLVQRPEVALRQARQLQHRHRRRRRARPGRPRAVHRQEAVGRVHAHAALDARCCSSSRPSTPRAAASSSRSCAASSRTRSSSSRSTSPT